MNESASQVGWGQQFVGFRVRCMCEGMIVNPQKMGIGDVIPIFWTINDLPGLQGLMTATHS